ncbi:MAG: hypothetical protein IPP94_15625 [Ignavibacteria bacterium]|nr:hypothetical protein [Ignavibacteria bacterium]
MEWWSKYAPRLLGCLLLCASAAHAQEPRFVLDPGTPERLFAYTNKQAAFYCGAVNGENSNGFHGITQAKVKLFEQYWIEVNGTLLDRASARVELTPWSLKRSYLSLGVVEEVFFADSLTLLAVRITTDKSAQVTFIPAWSAHFKERTNALRGKRYSIDGDVRTIASSPDAQGEWEPSDQSRIDRLRNPGPMEAPAWFTGRTRGTTATFFVEFAALSAQIPERRASDFDKLLAAKEKRIRGVIDEAGFACSDSTTTFVAAWIRASMDALVMKQSGIGIYAGLPWFDDYWGRDTFISLPGALLVNGRFEEAKAVLKSFMSFQNRDEGSPNFGRIPNRVQPKEIIYNTVDGTPLFVRAAWRYIEASGDTAFARELLPFLERSIRGALKYHTDSSGFLTHGDADTWMDAVGPEGPWSPRGNRAVEVQALWCGQLKHSADIARLAGDPSKQNAWTLLEEKVVASFASAFISPMTGLLIDHLTVHNMTDERSRPNVLLALVAGTALFLRAQSDETIRRTVHRSFRECVYRYGVASLSQEDAAFHPYHEYPERYPKDAAYHNGIIWTWLSGPAVSILCSNDAEDSAWVLTKALEHLALTQGAAGTLPECTDAIARPGETEPRWSGTFSQAWSNAEYLRSLSDDYLGLRPSALGDSLVLTIFPALPKSIASMSSNVRVGSVTLSVRIDREEHDTWRATVRHVNGKAAVTLALIYAAAMGNVRTVRLFPGETQILNAPILKRSGAIFPVSFCEPRLDSSLASIRAPRHRMLDGETVTSKNPSAKQAVSMNDPAGDDTGPVGSFVYPKSPYFKKGMFDLRKFSVALDRDNAYFTIQMGALAQPGWHPEYGFQLTMLAIGIDQSGIPARQSRSFGNNSRHTLPKKQGFDKLILVGGGLRITDKEGIILAEYIPRTVKDAFGDVRSATISFAIPLSVLGPNADTWSYHVIAGAQDDHGGAGIGEFREVLPQPTEWNGGGGSPAGSNVYDTLFAAPR